MMKIVVVMMEEFECRELMMVERWDDGERGVLICGMEWVAGEVR
jgi:hypothetical protein